MPVRDNHFRQLYRRPITNAGTFQQLRQEYNRQEREASLTEMQYHYPNYSRELLSILRKYYKVRKSK